VGVPALTGTTLAAIRESAAVDFEGDGYADLAVSATGEDGVNGAVRCLRGRPTGLITDAALVFSSAGRRWGAPYTKAGCGSEPK
jgi:hypothetical protein